VSRELLPQRRRSETFEFSDGKVAYTATIGFYEDGRPGEIFLSAGKAGTLIHTYVRDGAIAISFALQHGCSVEAIRTAFTRNADGVPEGPLGILMDMLINRKRN
jgi:hypothetical protein